MSNDIPPNDSDHALARKRLARELRILICVHIVALCVATLFFVGSCYVPNYRTWDEIHLLCRVLALSGIIVFVVAPFWGFGKIIYAGFISDMMLTYCLGAWALLIVFFLLSPVGGLPPIFFAIFCCCFSLYCTIPQFFIARWLARKAEEKVQIEGLPKEQSGDGV